MAIQFPACTGFSLSSTQSGSQWWQSLSWFLRREISQRCSDLPLVSQGKLFLLSLLLTEANVVTRNRKDWGLCSYYNIGSLGPKPALLHSQQTALPWKPIYCFCLPYSVSFSLKGRALGLKNPNEFNPSFACELIHSGWFPPLP